MRLKNKVAVITGAGRGIGRAVALAFAREGASVIVNDVDEEPANGVVKEIQSLGGKAASVVADIRYKSEAEKTIKAAIDNFAKIDILVNNAGALRDIALHKMTEEDWDFIVDLCLKGTFLCTQAAATYMVQAAKQEHEAGKEISARKIINVTSGSGIRGNPGQANYSAAKAGIIGLTKSNAKELARFNILVNAIAPMAWTRLTLDMPEEWKKTMVSTRIPLGRGGDPEKDIAPVVVFLASDDSNYITGQIISVSGGLDM